MARQVVETKKKVLPFKVGLVHLTNGMYKTTLPQLIMLYIAKQPKTDFFSFIKKEYIEYKNTRVEEAINSLPD